MTVPKGLRVNLLMTRFDLEVEVGPPLPGQIAPGTQQFAVAAGLMEGANAHAGHHDEKDRQESGERVLSAEAEQREGAVVIVVVG